MSEQSSITRHCPHPSLSICWCHLKSHLFFSLSYPAFWLFSHLYSALRAQWLVIWDILVAIRRCRVVEFTMLTFTLKLCHHFHWDVWQTCVISVWNIRPLILVQSFMFLTYCNVWQASAFIVKKCFVFCVWFVQIFSYQSSVRVEKI